MADSYHTRHVGRLLVLNNRVANRQVYANVATDVIGPFTSIDRETVFREVDITIDELPADEAVVDGTYPITSFEGKSYTVTIPKNFGLPLFVSVSQPSRTCLGFRCFQQTPPGAGPIVPYQCSHCFATYCSEECQAADADRHNRSLMCFMTSTAIGMNPHPDAQLLFNPHA